MKGFWLSTPLYFLSYLDVSLKNSPFCLKSRAVWLGQEMLSPACGISDTASLRGFGKLA